MVRGGRLGVSIWRALDCKLSLVGHGADLGVELERIRVKIPLPSFVLNRREMRMEIELTLYAFASLVLLCSNSDISDW